MTLTLWSQSNVQFIGFNKEPLATDIRFFWSGTREPVTVFRDPDGTSPHPTSAKSDAAGRTPAIYFKRDARKLRAEITSGNFRVKVLDGIDPGRPETEAAATGASPLLPSKSHAAATIAPEDFGTFLEVTTATGTVKPLSLPKATAVPDGRIIGINNNGGGYIVARANGTDLIGGKKAVLIQPNTAALIRATGAGFEVFAREPERKTQWAVKTRGAKSPPGSSTAGDIYLAPADATGWTPDRIHIADGAGGFNSITPEKGDRAVVQDEAAVAGTGTDQVSVPLGLIFTGEKWVSEVAFAKGAAGDAAAAKIAPVELRVKALEDKPATSGGQITFRNAPSSGTNSLTAQGGTQPTAGTWTRNKLDTSLGTLKDAGLSGDIITLAKGKYSVRARRKGKGQISLVVGFRNTSGTTFVKGMPVIADTNANVVAELDAPFEVAAATDTFELVFLLGGPGTVGALSLGDAAAIPGESEVYAEVTITARA